MQQYVAFVSGLPCGRDSVGMNTLRNLFSRLGFLNVETFLTNGNVIFETAPVGLIGPLEAQISRFLNKSLESDGIHVFIRTPEQLRGILDNVPFPADEVRADGSHLFVVLLSEEPDDQVKKKLKIRRSDVDELGLHAKEIYWLRRPSHEQIAPPSLGDILDAPATVRSFQTIARLVATCTSDHARKIPPIDVSQSAQSRQ